MNSKIHYLKKAQRGKVQCNHAQRNKKNVGIPVQASQCETSTSPWYGLGMCMEVLCLSKENDFPGLASKIVSHVGKFLKQSPKKGRSL